MRPNSFPANAAESAQWLIAKDSGNTTNLRSLPHGILPEEGDVVAQVVSIEPSYRLVGLTFADGHSEQIKIALPFDVQAMRKGQYVVLRRTEVPLRFKGQ